MAMTIKEFIAHFCGPDRDESETAEEMGYRDWKEVQKEMEDTILSRQITDADHIDTRVAAKKFWKEVTREYWEPILGADFDQFIERNRNEN